MGAKQCSLCKQTHGECTGIINLLNDNEQKKNLKESIDDDYDFMDDVNVNNKKKKKKKERKIKMIKKKRSIARPFSQMNAGFNAYSYHVRGNEGGEYLIRPYEDPDLSVL